MSDRISSKKILVTGISYVFIVAIPHEYALWILYAGTVWAFIYLSYDYFNSKNNGLDFVFAALTLLFQPFFKIALGRAIWNIVDVLVAAGLIFLTVNAVKRK